MNLLGSGFAIKGRFELSILKVVKLIELASLVGVGYDSILKTDQLLLKKRVWDNQVGKHGEGIGAQD